MVTVELEHLVSENHTITRAVHGVGARGMCPHIIFGLVCIVGPYFNGVRILDLLTFFKKYRRVVAKACMKFPELCTVRS